MEMEFVAVKLNAAYTEKYNLQGELEIRKASLRHIEKELNYLALQIKTLEVLATQPDGVTIKAVNYPLAAPVNLEKQAGQIPTPAPPPTKKKAKKR